MKKSPLMDQVAAYLEGRPDIRILASGDGTAGPRIIASQLRRIWHKKIWNAAVFTPHERDIWFYYGQTLLIEEASFENGELVDAQKELIKEMRNGGVDVLLPQTMTFVKEQLGPEPENWKDYVNRVEK